MSDYDKSNDILYVRLSATPIASYGEETQDGVVLMKSFENNEVTGITVFYPKRDRKQREAQLKLLGYPLNLHQFTN